MYVPKTFALTDSAVVAEVIRSHGFAPLITAVGGPPQATHLPFLYDADRGPHGTLIAHMARANPHWRDFSRLGAEGGEALVIFQGPHVYVSPRWYTGGPAVPTWNYVTVHAYGMPRVVEEPTQVRGILERLVETHESGSPRPWSLDSQDEKFLAGMMRGIVAFEIPLARIEAKAKLNQNRPPEDRRGVVDALATHDDQAKEVAALMERLSF